MRHQITALRQSTEQRIDFRIEGMEVCLIVDDNTGKIRIHTHQPSALGKLIDGEGVMVKVDHFGHPYED